MFFYDIPISLLFTACQVHRLVLYTVAALICGPFGKALYLGLLETSEGPNVLEPVSMELL